MATKKIQIETWNGIPYTQSYASNTTPIRRAWWNPTLQYIVQDSPDAKFGIDTIGNGRSDFDWIAKQKFLKKQEFSISQELSQILEEECRKQEEWVEKCRQHEAEQDQFHADLARSAGAPCAYWDKSYVNNGFYNLRVYFIASDGRKSIFRQDGYGDCFGDHWSNWVLEEGDLSPKEEAMCRAFLAWKPKVGESTLAKWQKWVEAGKP